MDALPLPSPALVPVNGYGPGESAPLTAQELLAQPHWRSVDFISDLHLQAGDALTAQAWTRYLQSPADARADALIILGDLFEVWIGDDLLASTDADLPDQTVQEAQFLRRCCDLLQTFSQHTPVYFMHGNRDFLLGPTALQAMGLQGLSDPTVLVFQGQRWLLSHGDALCLDDIDYQGFRAQVRTPVWQRQFLSQSLTERARQAAAIRQQSRSRKQKTADRPELWADVDTPAARGQLQASSARTLIHGHTHRPGQHDLGEGLQRVVLSDWDVAATPPRAEVLRLSASGLMRLAWPLAADGLRTDPVSTAHP